MTKALASSFMSAVVVMAVTGVYFTRQKRSDNTETALPFDLNRFVPSTYYPNDKLFDSSIYIVTVDANKTVEDRKLRVKEVKWSNKSIFFSFYYR